jgi:SAM-dependent methyltransferase
MTGEHDPWDAEYQRRGRLWGGSSPDFPGLQRSLRVLELGCGDGKTVSSLLRAGSQVTAIDCSSHAALLCRKNRPEPDRVGILVADARETPFRTGSFDAVTASHVAGHLSREGRERLAGEVVRLLSPGGTLYFRDFSREDFRCGRGKPTEAGTFEKKNGICTHYFTGGEVRELFFGLSVTSLVLHRWEMRIRGTACPRAEIVAEFTRPA